MSKSRRNTLKNKCLRSSRGTLVDWGSLLSLIADDLDACTAELKARRRRILEIQARYFISHKPFEEPPLRGLRILLVHSIASTMELNM